MYLIANDEEFVSSVISYLEVKLAVFKNWFTTPQKRTKTRGKVSEKISSRVGMELKKV